jgi:hypothetical protein
MFPSKYGEIKININTLCMYEKSGGTFFVCLFVFLFFVFVLLCHSENWTQRETLDSLSLMAATV